MNYTIKINDDGKTTKLSLVMKSDNIDIRKVFVQTFNDQNYKAILKMAELLVEAEEDEQ